MEENIINLFDEDDLLELIQADDKDFNILVEELRRPSKNMDDSING